MSEITPRSMGALQDALSGLDVDMVGIASVADLEGSWLHKQVVGLLPEARSIVVFGMEIFPEVLDHSRPDKTMGEANARDMLAPHMDYLNGRLTKAAYDVAKLCRRQGLRALPMPAAAQPTDQRHLAAILSFKHAAEAAGLGTIGRSSLLVTPRFGPRARLACVLLEADLQPSPRVEVGGCDGCDLCMQTCPARALAEPRNGEPYSINKFACQAFRNGTGGCSECMRLCPMGR